MSRGWIIVGLVCLAGCASENTSTDAQNPGLSDSIVGRFFSGTVQGAVDAVVSPFEDIGLKKDEIPEPLQKIAKNPYAMPPAPRCANVRKEISTLDALLGPDENLTPSEADTRSEERQYADKGADLAAKQASGILRSHVDILPYRSVVRMVSGADKHAKEVSKAYEAGKMRRAFLAGLASNMGGKCLSQTATKKPAKAKKTTELAARDDL